MWCTRESDVWKIWNHMSGFAVLELIFQLKIRSIREFGLRNSSFQYLFILCRHLVSVEHVIQLNSISFEQNSISKRHLLIRVFNRIVRRFWHLRSRKIVHVLLPGMQRRSENPMWDRKLAEKNRKIKTNNPKTAHSASVVLSAVIRYLRGLCLNPRWRRISTVFGWCWYTEGLAI